MNNFERQLYKIGHSIRMTSQEKDHMRILLRRAMKSTYAAETPALARASWSNTNIVFLLRNSLPIALILTLVIGAGVSSAAEGALPGDLLYPVKISINEQMKETFAFTPEAKAQWETERVERRLVEAATLSASGELDAEKEQILAEQFEKHAQNIAERIKEFEERDPGLAQELAARFGISIEAHEEILVRLSLRNSNNENDSTGEMLSLVKKNRDFIRSIHDAGPAAFQVSIGASADTFAAVENTPSSKRMMSIGGDKETAAEHMRKSAESKALEVSRLIQKYETNLSTSTITQAKADFAVITKTISEGRGFLQNGQEHEALGRFQSAFTLAYKLQILLEAEYKHKLQVFPVIPAVLYEEDDASTPSSGSFSDGMNVYLQREADWMKGKAETSIMEVIAKLSEKILRPEHITTKAKDLLTVAQETRLKAERAYAEKNYTGALRLWNISDANAKAALTLLSNNSWEDVQTENDDSKTSTSSPIEIEQETETHIDVETEDMKIETESGLKIKVF